MKQVLKGKRIPQAGLRIAMVLAAFFAVGVLFIACGQPDIETDPNRSIGGGGDIYIAEASLAASLQKVKDIGKPDVSYIITVKDDEAAFAPRTLSESAGFPKNAAITLRSAEGGTKTVQLGGQGALFTVSDTIKLVLDTITLKGIENNNSALVVMTGDSQLEMKTGSKITGNTNTEIGYPGGGVCVDGGKKFTMSDGSISGNTVYGSGVSGGGGVNVRSGIFTMSGNAVISGNTANEGNGGGVYVGTGGFTMSGNAVINGNTADNNGGGIYVGNGGFTMSGNAAISRNTADNNGGGVYISGHTFSKTGGTIYGSDGGDLKNTAGTNGHAVYVYKSWNSPAYFRNTTAGPDVNLSSTDLANWE